MLTYVQLQQYLMQVLVWYACIALAMTLLSC